MAIGLNKTLVLELQLTDNDVDLFQFGIDQLLKELNKPGFRKKENAENIISLFSEIQERINEKKEE